MYFHPRFLLLAPKSWYIGIKISSELPLSFHPFMSKSYPNPIHLLTLTLFCWTFLREAKTSMVSCHKGPTCHAYAWQIGPFWQDTIDIFYIIPWHWQSSWSWKSSSLTHWGRVTHICVSKLTIIGSGNGLSPGRRWAIIWTNDGILPIGPLGTNFS